jgi:hypothetical protein
VEIKFKYYSISINQQEVDILEKIINPDLEVSAFGIDDWTIIDLLYKKHIIIHDKTRERKPEIQPWCRTVVLRHLSENQSGS